MEKNEGYIPSSLAVGPLVWAGSETKNFMIQRLQFSEFQVLVKLFE